MKSGNKRRLYLAYDHRKSTPTSPSKFHVSLFLTPKSPDVMNTKIACWRYHVLDRLPPGENDPDHALTGMDAHWEFKCQREIARPGTMRGVLLLGKIPNSVSCEEIEKVLKEVYVQPTVAENVAWRCNNWACEAISLLVQRGIISNLHKTPEEIYKAGYAFLDGSAPKRDSDPLPCCDINGHAISSEIAGLRDKTLEYNGYV